MPERRNESSAAQGQDWIVLGNREHGVSYGPFTKEEAERFVSDIVPNGIALPFDGARSQIETCAAYGLPFKPRAES